MLLVGISAQELFYRRGKNVVEFISMLNEKKKIIKEIKKIDDAVIFELAGSFDMSCSMELRQELHDVLRDAPKKLIIDMAAVDCMDSSGLATLIEALKLSRKKMCSLRLSGINTRVKGVFEIARLESMFEFHDSVVSALQ